MKELKYDWTKAEVDALFELPFFELAHQAQTIHRLWHPASEIQLCTLSNIKQGGCPEDCAYCPQAARYHTDVEAEPLLSVSTVLDQARIAKEHGASRFCMGAAWRHVRDNEEFDQVLSMVREVADMGLEVCATLGMVNNDQAQRLADAGLYAYNHNIDTSPDFYDQIISTRTFDERIETLQAVRDAGITVCCGGILGMGEETTDRAAMLHVLATMDPHPESVPINRLVKAPGTPLEDQDDLDIFDFLRTIAVARILMPGSMVRLAAGRTEMSREAQALAFLLGANSIFYGEKLLTTPNPEANEDRELLEVLGLEPRLAQPPTR
ncbi:MAG: biotin synthase BioB [Myxococcales bacterium]|nr:biotin synthase BioB [Myxococcales bacterium]